MKKGAIKMKVVTDTLTAPGSWEKTDRVASTGTTWVQRSRCLASIRPSPSWSNRQSRQGSVSWSLSDIDTRIHWLEALLVWEWRREDSRARPLPGPYCAWNEYV